MATEVNLLLTSVGRRVELVRALKEAYVQHGIKGKIIGTDIDELAPAMQEVDTPVVVPRYHDPEFIPALLKTCNENDVSAVFPLIDPDIPLLAQHCAEFEATGAKLAVVSHDAAKICSDKWLTYEFFQEIGVRCPRSWRKGEVDPAEACYPMFIKPRNGSASENIFRINNEKELLFFQDYVKNPILQECLPGPEITSDVVCDFHGNVISVVSRKRITVRGGEVVKGVTIFDEQISSACHSIARRLPAVGPITAQCMMKDGEPYFIEINARLGGGIPLAIAAGVDVAGMLLTIASGEPVKSFGSADYRTDMYMSRFDQSFFKAR